MKGCSKVFVTGTDTNVGKTMVSLALYEGFRMAGMAAKYWKPVQTGNADADHDFLAKHTSFPDGILKNLFTYTTPRSPDQAAKIENKEPATSAVIENASQALANDAVTLIEGAGGILVPLNDRGETWLSLLQSMAWPVVVVARPTLGTINHTALTLDKLASANITVLAVVFSGDFDAENARSLAQLFPRHTFLSLPLIDLSDRKIFLQEAKQLAQRLLEKMDQHSSLSRDNGALTLAQDRAHVWHPYTQHATAPEPVVITGAKGVWLKTAAGEKLFDATSSWWVNTIGHGRREIGACISAQQEQLDHVIFAGVTHARAAQLAGKVCTLSGGDFQRVFFSDNGSTAVEIALKMAYQSFTNSGNHQRTKFLHLKGGYHGDTLGALSVGGGDGFNDPYRPLLFKATPWAPVLSHTSRFDADRATATVKHFADYLEGHHQQYAALIVEPLVQGAGGMLMHDEAWLKAFCQTARDFGIPVIFDEVFSGMGRCGAWYAYQRLGWKPDLICLAKGLTGGTLPLALTLSTQHIYEQFLNDDKAHAFLAGHSYTGNPITCRAALTTIDIYERENLNARALAIEQEFQAWIARHAKPLGLVSPRCVGSILAFELPGTGTGGYFHGIAGRIPDLARQHGLWLRPLGNTIYLLPPLSVTDEELHFALDKLRLMIAENF